MNIEDLTERILEETDYIEDATENGYPQYTETEAVNAAHAIQSKEEMEILQNLRYGETLYDTHYAGIGQDLKRWEENNLIERPEKGEELVKITRLTQTYLRYQEQI